MIPLLVFSGLLVTAMAVAIVVGIRHAVDGYEDETGFHRLKTPTAAPKISTRPARSAASAIADVGGVTSPHDVAPVSSR
jgi:hypothetical protein